MPHMANNELFEELVYFFLVIFDTSLILIVCIYYKFTNEMAEVNTEKITATSS